MAVGSLIKIGINPINTRCVTPCPGTVPVSKADMQSIDIIREHVNHTDISVFPEYECLYVVPEENYFWEGMEVGPFELVDSKNVSNNIIDNNISCILIPQATDQNIVSLVFNTITKKISDISKLPTNLPVEIFDNESYLIPREEYISAAAVFSRYNPDDLSALGIFEKIANTEKIHLRLTIEHIKKYSFGYTSFFLSSFCAGLGYSASFLPETSPDKAMIKIAMYVLSGLFSSLLIIFGVTGVKMANNPSSMIQELDFQEALKNAHLELLQKTMRPGVLLDEEINNKILLLFQILDLADSKLFNSMWDLLPKNVLEQMDPTSDYWKDIEDEKLKDEIMKAAQEYQERIEKMRQASLFQLNGRSQLYLRPAPSKELPPNNTPLLMENNP